MVFISITFIRLQTWFVPLSSESLLSFLFSVLFLYLWYQKSYHGTIITQSIRVTVPESSGNSQKSLWVDWLKLHTHSPDQSCGQSNREHDLLHPQSVPLKPHSHKPGMEGMVDKSPWLRVNVRKKEERAKGEFDNNKVNFTLQLVQP